MADEIVVDTNKENERPSSIHDLKPKMKLTGRVTRIDLYGAFVDIGIGQDALIHISKIKKGSVNRVDEVLSVDDSVDVFVDRIDVQNGRVSLTMIKPLDVTWQDLKKGQVYSGTVTRLEQYGIFVDIGAERSGLVHISELGDGFIKHPNELYAIDQQVEVRVADYDRKKRRIDLSIVREHEDAVIVEDEEDIPTAMEMALRKAFEGSDSPITLRKRQSRRSRRTRRRSQEDILSRTLRNRKA